MDDLLMMIRDNTAYLDNIRDYVDKSLSKNSFPLKIKEVVKDNLSRLFHNKLEFEVDYVNPNKVDLSKNPHFVMAVHPDLDEIAGKPDLIDSLTKGDMSKFVNAWKTIHSWFIEIEYDTINPKSSICVKNGSEFVALLCHELGHIFHTAPIKVWYNFNNMKNRSNLYIKMMLESPSVYIYKLFLPVFTACDAFVVLVTKPISDLKSLGEEIHADSCVPYAYKPYLVSYITNVVATNPVVKNSLIKQHVEYDNETSKMVQFTAKSIDQLKVRNRALKVALDFQAKTTPSRYLSKMCDMISDTVVPKYKDKRLVDVVKESAFYNAVDTMYDDAVREARTILESSNVTERDIAILQTDIDGIQTIDDKNYVLNTIFDYIETLEAQRDKTIKKIKDVTKIPDSVLNDPKLIQLNEMKKNVMAMKVTNYTGDHYGLFVKYPKGYEG